MSKTGPKPKCDCGTCPLCVRRATAMRSYWRLRGHDVPYRRKLRTSQLRLPDDATVIPYIAGLMDGEGTIGKQNGCWRVQIGMTHEGVIKWLGQFGGTVQPDKRKPPRQVLWRWRLMRQRDVRDFLAAVLPYMRVRDDRAREALDELLALERMA